MVWIICFKLSNGSSLWKSSKAEVIDINEERVTCSELSIYDEVKLQEAIDSCVTKSSRDRINSIDDLYLRGAELIAEMNYYPTRFPKRINIYDKMYETKEVLNIPFSSDDFNGIVFIDEI